MTEQTFPEYIKQHTKTEHAQLEKKLIGIIKSIRTTAQYIDLLRMFHGYYHALEHKMDQYLTVDHVPDIEERRKSDALLQDIRDIGGESQWQSVTVTTPAINNYPQALGAAYVLEGSTLGGVIIAKMIRAQLPEIPTGKGFTFFNCYGEDATVMWKKFHTYLLALTHTNDQQATADTARQTFLKFNDWIDQYEPVF